MSALCHKRTFSADNKLTDLALIVYLRYDKPPIRAFNSITNIIHECILYRMDEGNIKYKIFLLQAVDWLLVIGVMSVGISAILYAENRNLMGLAAIIGLFFVNKSGNFTTVKIAQLRVDLEKQQRLSKKYKI